MHSNTYQHDVQKRNRKQQNIEQGFKMLHLKVYDSKSQIIKDKITRQIQMLDHKQEKHILDIIEQNADLDDWN